MKTRLQLPLFTLLITLLCLGMSPKVFAQYTGTGVFEEITSTAELTDGYYVILNESSQFIMTSDRSGSLTTGFYVSADATLSSGTIVNPSATNVWQIEVNGSGRTIYNEVIEKYVGWISGNAASAEETVADRTRWTFSYMNDKFTVNNVNTPVRQLSYNSAAPRFAAYGNDGQQELQLYKLIEASEDPIFSVSPISLINLEYEEGDGPSASQSFELSGLNLDGTEVTVALPTTPDFEISADGDNFFDFLNFPAYDGASTTIYVRLKEGLTINTYTNNITISGGGADPVSVSLSGAVFPNFDGMETFENFPVTTVSYSSGDFLGVNGNTWNYINARGDIDISDETVTLQNNISASLNSTIEGGISSFSFDYQQAFSTNVNLDVFVNGVLITTVTSANEQGVVKNSGLVTIDPPVTGDFNIEFKQNTSPTGGQVAIDNFSWVSAQIEADYTYEDGTWSPESPVGPSTETDDILIVNGTAVFNQSIEMNNLYILTGASLEVENILTVNGDITNDGTIVFKSTSVENTAQLDAFTGSITGSGEVTVERFIPARRAFRLLSSPVTTSGTINDNWQEGASNATNDPNPGFGTHITGSTDGSNGFDATLSGNPSLFTFNNTAQSWEAVTNTDVNTFAAGSPYRLLVRGDRSIDVTSNSSTPTPTTLRTTGTLQTGAIAFEDFSDVEEGFNFFGNPYPAIVDMNAVLETATNENVNPNSYYIWDPNMNTRGAYVTIELDPLTPTPDQYLQPGQAGFVRTLIDGEASLTFLESHKAVTQPLTQVFSVVSKIDLHLFTASAFAQSETAADGLKIKFSEEYTNAITPQDASKFYNLDENLASVNDDRLWSIESRALPLEGESIPLFNDRYRTTDYVFEAELTEINGVTALLRDHFTGTDTDLVNNDTTIYSFSVDPADAASIAEDRFEIVFEELLGTNEVSFGNNFVLFPNPAQGDINLATKGISGDDVNLKITSITGQQVYSQAHTVNINGQLAVDTAALAPGVYILKLTHNGGQFTTKFIKK